MFIPIDSTCNSFKDYILIVPSVSVGNVGQLTADLLICTLDMTRIGYIQHSGLLPLVGGDPYTDQDATACGIATACEVFECTKHKVLVIQQRTPFVKGKRGLYRKWLVNWIRDSQFRRVVIVTSSSAQERIDIQLVGSQLRYVACPQIEAACGETFRQEYGWHDLERRPCFPAPAAVSRSSDTGADSELYIPGGGIAKTLFEDLRDDVPVAIVLRFCAEGDNAPDAVHLATSLNTWLNLVHDQKRDVRDLTKTGADTHSWKIPVSWKLFYGTTFDQSLYH